MKLLDCTLRDGGYVNSFAFGENTARNIIHNLIEANIEYIEVGFLRNVKKSTETTIFTTTSEVDALLPTEQYNAKIFAMIVFGQYDIDKLPPKSQTKIDGIRVTFKKHEINAALPYIQEIQKKGYIVSANPTVVNSYSDEELLSLVKKINAYHPDIFAIVDTLGVLKRNALLRLFYLINHNLDADIALAFHSHNNLQLSFSNAQALLELHSEREIIIDSSLSGMGRGAGNLCTELLAQYLNDNLGKKYNLLPILVCIDEQISKISLQYSWGYNVPYYLAASMQCHPNYASFLSDKASVSIECISEILAAIPDDKKSNYNEKLVQELYLKYQENEVDDTELVRKLHKEIGTKDVLIMAPGKTIVSEAAKINTYIALHNPFIISINFRPKDIAVDYVFIANSRRFSEQDSLEKVIVTSNIKCNNVLKLNYGSYLNNSDMADNSALMLLKVLSKIGVKKVAFAGMDGFSDNRDNYFALEMINNAKLGEEFDRRNEIMCAMLKKFARQTEINFVTTSLYEGKR